MKVIFLFVALILVSGFSDCGSQGPQVKLYVSNPEKGGLVRSQANELIPYANTKGYIALTADDAKTLLDYCLGPQGVDTSSTEIQTKIKQISQNGY